MGEGKNVGQNLRPPRYWGALGADATIESIAARTRQTVKSVRAKIARLDHREHYIYGSTGSDG